MHWDIKPDNLLVSRSGVVKLTDLGFSRKLEATSVHLIGWKGTLAYMPPELLLGEIKYSTGVALAESIVLKCGVTRPYSLSTVCYSFTVRPVDVGHGKTQESFSRSYLSCSGPRHCGHCR